MNRALFLDRDGIFNKVVFREGAMHSPRNWNEVEHESGLSVLSEIKSRGYKLILITNQPDIERNIVSNKFVDELHAYYQSEYGLDAVYVCPFASNDHPDKKPNPGLLLTARDEHEIDLKRSYFLGDTERDMGAAGQAGCEFILLSRPYNLDVKAPIRIDRLDQLLTTLSIQCI